MNQHSLLLVERRDRVGIIHLNRPQQMNAINEQLSAELLDTLSAFDKDDEIGSILIHGNKDCFAAGADLKHIATMNFETALRSDFADTISQIVNIRKPIIAAVSGIAYGAGTEIAMMCDIVIASESAMFALPEVSLGVIPGAGGPSRLAHTVGKSKAMYYVLTGSPFNAKEAETMGISTFTFPIDIYFEKAVSIAQKIAAHPHLAVLAAKEAINQQTEIPLIAGLKHERALFYGLFGTADQKEGMSAFIEKRKPKFY